MATVLDEAKSTCQGLHRLLQKIGEAAAERDQGSYEMHALLTSANHCVENLDTLLTILDSDANNDAELGNSVKSSNSNY